MQRDFDVVAIFQFINDCFDMQLTRTGQNKFFSLRDRGRSADSGLLREFYAAPS